jgi:hypothetical protein
MTPYWVDSSRQQTALISLESINDTVDKTGSSTASPVRVSRLLISRPGSGAAGPLDSMADNGAHAAIGLMGALVTDDGAHLPVQSVLWINTTVDKVNR